MKEEKQPTTRFTDRVQNYVRYRPSYPQAVIELLSEQATLTAESRIADIGAGTGILTSLLLETGAHVTCVEPNDAMRAMAEQTLGQSPKFVALGTPAEQTTLPDQSIDLITVAQAFHWFDQTAVRHEFARICRPNALVALIWNQRRSHDPFQQAYETLLRERVADYKNVTHRNIDDVDLAAWFAPNQMHIAQFEYMQTMDYPSLHGRLLSSSYAPTSEEPEYGALVDGLQTLFNRYAENGTIQFVYDTFVYYGRFDYLVSGGVKNQDE